ncbi:hypothetical protein DFH09DRAFT_1104892 [Mycena vulgaris]|nr:hypothetical protein DFH09DRAFT_1104892 [Mycena vulgaris]
MSIITTVERTGLLAWEAQSARSVGPKVRERCFWRSTADLKKVDVQGLGKFVPHVGMAPASAAGGMSGYLIEGCCEIIQTQNIFNEPQQHRYLHTARGTTYFSCLSDVPHCAIVAIFMIGPITRYSVGRQAKIVCINSSSCWQTDGYCMLLRTYSSAPATNIRFGAGSVAEE